uniref:Uncharacterized protein n=1 Tax=Physcomitrium patens TaxID=3218 RepID=A0A2K1IFM9_PHYPA|nr:hypothetical protein PHYPA_028671 [Physcomitrium patens]
MVDYDQIVLFLIHISKLSNFNELFLNMCGELKTLPNIISKLKRFEGLTLRMANFYQIIFLPSSISKLSNFKELIFDMYGKLETLPNTISEVKRFEGLNLRSCKSLHILLPSISNLISLQILLKVNCDQIVLLPSPIYKLSNLKELILDMCGELETLPNTISNLSKLLEFILDRNYKSLQILSPSISILTSLQIIIAVDFDQLLQLFNLKESVLDRL